MATLRGPLLSFSARGSIAKTQTYSSWRGIAYARQLVTPQNPKTAAQTLTRSVFAYLSNLWRAMGPLGTAPWDAFTTGRPLTDRNGFNKINIAPLRPVTEVNLDNLIMSPGARGGPSMGAFAAVPGALAGEIDVTISAPTLPVGWTVTRAVANVVKDQDPHLAYAGSYAELEDLAAPYALDFVGLTAGGVYLVSGFIEYAKPDGTAAYSVSANQLVTATP